MALPAFTQWPLGVDLFMQLPGLTGPSRAIGHTGWFELNAASAPVVTDGLLVPALAVARPLGTSGITLLQALASGASLGDVTIQVCRAGLGPAPCFLTYLLEGATLDSMALGAETIGWNVEAMALRFRALTVTYREVTATGQSGPAASVRTPVPATSADAALQAVAPPAGPNSAPGTSFVNVLGLIGESAGPSHPGWSDGAGLRLTAARRGGGVHFAARLSTAIDSASPGLLALGAAGGPVDLVSADACIPSDARICPIRFQLGEGRVSAFGVAPGGSLEAFEVVEPTSVSVTLRGQLANGSLENPVTLQWP
jgi:type VI protein secretion system component Hcp